MLSDFKFNIIQYYQIKVNDRYKKIAEEKLAKIEYPLTELGISKKYQLSECITV